MSHGLRIASLDQLGPNYEVVQGVPRLRAGLRGGSGRVISTGPGEPVSQGIAHPAGSGSREGGVVAPKGGAGASASWSASRPRETAPPSGPAFGTPAQYALAERLIANRCKAGGVKGPEDQTQRDIVAGCDALVFKRIAPVVAIMLVNEIRQPAFRRAGGRQRALPGMAGGDAPGWKAAQLMGARLLAMGLLPGASDLILIWPGDDDFFGGVGFMEVKRPARTEQTLTGPKRYQAGYLEDRQRDFRDLCQAWRLPWGCARGFDPDALRIMREWGALPDAALV